MSKTITSIALLLAFGLSACANSSSSAGPEPEAVEITPEPVTQKY